MEENNDFVFFVMAIALVQMTVSYLLLKECKNRRRWWILPDKQERSYLWEYTLLCFWSTNIRIMKNFSKWWDFQ